MGPFDDFNPYQFYELDEDQSESLYAVDSFFYEAQKDLIGLFTENPKKGYYIRQLQVRLEEKYFHWITANTLEGLLGMGRLKEKRVPSARGGMSSSFFMHPGNRYTKREIKKTQGIIEVYSRPEITISCGIRAENMFCAGLAEKGFMPRDKKLRSFQGKTWEKSGHDLDYLFERDGISYGCEIKNTLSYIPNGL